VTVQPAAVLTDIEGTTTPIAFVHDVLFPYAQARLAAFCAAHEDHPALAEVARLAPGADPLETLLTWMARDEKIAPLKDIQGMIWAEGYASGELTGALYPEVAPALRLWAQAGVRLLVYSSGSVAAQRLLFGHTDTGDLTPLFAGFFDTASGSKRDAASYAGICQESGVLPRETLFLSDVPAELDAAASAGLRTCQLVRPADGTQQSGNHPVAANFAEVAVRFGLPRLTAAQTGAASPA
jgi:enolase-phosphatase E1